MTQRLYYTDCYLQAFSARIVRVEDSGRRVYLDRTAFYPTSGGQPHDLGQIGQAPVVQIEDEGEDIAHLIAEPLSAGELVDCAIEWRRRWDHMQQHTAQHLLSAVWSETFGVATVSFHLGEQVSTIELNAKQLGSDQISEVENRANALCWEARAVQVKSEEAQSAIGLRKASERSGLLRIVEIAGLDRNACGGTHVRSTAELAPIEMRGTERIRGHVRIEFLAGGRCVRRNRADYDRLTRAAREAGSPADDLVERVAKLKERATLAEKEASRLRVEAARVEGLGLSAHAVPDDDGVRRVFLEERIDETCKSRVQAFATGQRAVAVAVSRDTATALLACSGDTNMDAGQIIKSNLPRGGGSRTIAQGTFQEQQQLENLLRAVGLFSEPA